MAKVCVKGSYLLPQDQELLYQEELPVHGSAALCHRPASQLHARPLLHMMYMRKNCPGIHRKCARAISDMLILSKSCHAAFDETAA